MGHGAEDFALDGGEVGVEEVDVDGGFIHIVGPHHGVVALRLAVLDGDAGEGSLHHGQESLLRVDIAFEFAALELGEGNVLAAHDVLQLGRAYLHALAFARRLLHQCEGECASVCGDEGEHGAEVLVLACGDGEGIDEVVLHFCHALCIDVGVCRIFVHADPYVDGGFAVGFAVEEAVDGGAFGNFLWELPVDGFDGGLKLSGFVLAGCEEREKAATQKGCGQKGDDVILHP